MSSDNSLEKSLNIIVESYISDVNVSIPCIVEKYENGRVTVTPAIKRIFEDGSEVGLSSIPDVPIAYPASSVYSITFPIEVGDEGILIFSHRDISAFKASGKLDIPVTYRKHSLADAIFIPCVVTSTVQHTELKITDGTAEIKMGSGQIDLNGTILINGQPFSTHTHSGVQTGGGVTGPVV